MWQCDWSKDGGRSKDRVVIVVELTILQPPSEFCLSFFFTEGQGFQISLEERGSGLAEPCWNLKEYKL